METPGLTPPGADQDNASLSALAGMLEHLGCPKGQSTVMAAQLDKRAHQLATAKSKPYEEALMHLLRLMRQGWAAKEKGL